MKILRMCMGGYSLTELLSRNVIVKYCFYRLVRAFYVASVKKVIKHFPFDKSLLRDSRLLGKEHLSDIEIESDSGG